MSCARRISRRLAYAGRPKTQEGERVLAAAPVLGRCGCEITESLAVSEGAQESVHVLLRLKS